MCQAVMSRYHFFSAWSGQRRWRLCGRDDGCAGGAGRQSVNRHDALLVRRCCVQQKADEDS